LVSGKLRRGGATAFAVTSAVGNYLAILAATAIMQLQPGSVHLVNENFVVAFWDQFVGICESYGVGGLLGGTILGAASMWLLRRTLRGTLRCATAGMLLGVVFGLITLADANFTLPLGFAIWQAGYAIALATCVPRTSAFPRVNLGRFGRLLST
jgi:multisubunit Na+/H+ antiporter MnhE subunit